MERGRVLAKRDESTSANIEDLMDGFGASHGILLVFDNTKAQNLENVRATCEQIPRVSVQTLDCAAEANRAKAKPVRAGKKLESQLRPRKRKAQTRRVR